MSTIERIEKTFDRRRLVFHLRERDVVMAYGQTAGGWGKVEDPLPLAMKYFSSEELRNTKYEGKTN